MVYLYCYKFWGFLYHFFWLNLYYLLLSRSRLLGLRAMWHFISVLICEYLLYHLSTRPPSHSTLHTWLGGASYLGGSPYLRLNILACGLEFNFLSSALITISIRSTFFLRIQKYMRTLKFNNSDPHSLFRWDLVSHWHQKIWVNRFVCIFWVLDLIFCG